ncbi:hypothetical protein ACK8GE_01060 [Micromonosporaceae bacterium DT194]|uniref:hypothetical protein n=1 Tax=Melissospora conviva TaxID=3388432 RepID=UPI003C25D031
MTPLLAVFLVLVVSATSYAAGRLHGQLSYRVGYRFGYRQGYFDGDRGAWHRRRYESSSALAAVLTGQASESPVPESSPRGTTYRGGAFVPATVTTRNAVAAERTAAVGAGTSPVNAVRPVTRRAGNAAVTGRAETGKPVNAAAVPGRAPAWKPVTKRPAPAAAMPTVSAPTTAQPGGITAVSPAPPGTPVRMPRSSVPAPERPAGNDEPTPGTPGD